MLKMPGSTIKKGIGKEEIVLFQIALLISLVFANPLLFAWYSGDLNSHDDGLYGEMFGYLEDFFSIEEIQTVSASENDWCCVKENSDGTGKTCTSMKSDDAKDCSEYERSPCSEDVGSCSVGTCVYKEGISCSSNAVKWKCKDNEGKYYNKPRQELSQCQKGCCDLGDGARYVTRKKCNEKLDPVEFDSSKSRQQCFKDSSGELEKGACVGEHGSCKFVSPGDCATEGTEKEFHAGKLCTNSDLDTDCEPTTKTTCTGKENDYSVYFVDSCDQLANVYDSSKTYEQDPGYWQERVSPDCDSKPGSSSCGKCDYPQESKCDFAEDSNSVDYGNYICKDMTCEDYKGNERKNGESWCVYESDLSEREGTVGSEHWLRYCEDGEVKTDTSQKKKRHEICTETTNEEGISVAEYRPNMAYRCLEINDEDNSEEKCNENPDCRMQDLEVSEDGGVHTNVCVPKYPLGFDQKTDGSSDRASEICGIGTMTCTRVESRGTSVSGYDPEGDSGKCTKLEFAKKANKFCRSLGDCGGYVNHQGTYQRDFVVKDKEDNDEPFSALNYQFLAHRMDWEKWSEFGGTETVSKKMSSEFSNGSYVPNYIDTAKPGSLGDHGGLVGGNATQAPLERGGNDFFYGITSDFAMKGWSGDGTGIPLVDILIVGIVVTAVSGFVETIIKGVTWLFGLKLWGDVKKTKFQYECRPWTPPSGGRDCSSCQEEGLPCTKYKCNSISAGCEFRKGNTEGSAVCANEASNDKTAPEISFDGTKRNYGYSELDGKDGVEVGGCIEKNSELDFEISTTENGEDEYTSCSYSYGELDYQSVRENGVEMSYSGSASSWKTTHNFGGQFSLSEEKDYSGNLYNVSVTDTEKKGYLDFNVICQDPAGNLADYTVKTCLTSKDKTPPVVQRAEPSDGGYVGYGKNSSNVTLFLNEDVEGCKYDFKEDTEYSEMTNAFNCTGNLCLKEPMKELDQETNDVYIKCNDTAGNVQEDAFEYTLKETSDPLIVESASLVTSNLNGEKSHNLNFSGKMTNLVDGGDSYGMDLEVETSGGAGQDRVLCEYVYENRPSGLEGLSGSGMLKESPHSHNREINSLPEGIYEIRIICEDGVNKGSEKTKFNLSIDRSPPVISNMTDSGKLVVNTSEPSQCSYSHKSCNFDFSNGNPFDFGTSEDFVKKQQVSWDPSKPYSIKCRDALDNKKCKSINQASVVKGPQTIMVWEESGELRLRTDRDAKCYYGFNGCNIDVSNEERVMSSGGYSRVHGVEWNPSTTHYIKCKDEWDNPNPGCSTIVRPHSVR